MKHCLFKIKAQTFVEYSLLFGIVVAVLISMSPFVQRMVQGMVKTVADQVGTQQDADQQDELRGHLVNSLARARVNQITQKIGSVGGATTYEYLADDVQTSSVQTVNLGFSERK
ncbi:MAG: hypothetical protein NUV91_04875 [Candidatus Omnitrophica bacterium]|nr:hypothetical protein [Candidatus Omnitrophota bacterium]